ncbi:MAG TPA: sugar-transfer associated ATP-grasp domain-containing protein [Gemmatimonadaceae bacterium]|nr:sugar-transfer associated ATP-grasp domain-containing protein [Gemmatimonadaceae bacterium]
MRTPEVRARASAGAWARLGLRLWHRLLTPGWLRPTPAARLRGWERVLRWRAAHTRAQRRRLLERAAWTPVRAWRQAGEAVAAFGAEVQAVSGVPPRGQRRQLWWLAVKRGLNTQSYLDFQLYRPDRRARASAYLQELEHTRVARWLSRQRDDGLAETFRGKARFSEWCRAHGLPGVPVLLEFDHGELVASRLPGDPASSLPRGDLFSKPNDATGGHGTERWRYVSDHGDGGWMARDGRIRSAAALLEELARTSLTLPLRDFRRSRRMLLQPCLRNHRDLLPLTPGALCTLRILTFRMPGERARVLLAAYRMAVGDAPADNFHFGGIITSVDLATGRLGVALRRQGHVLVPVERHPDTGTPIGGFPLPCWQQAVSLAERALDAAPGLPAVGWDVAITDDGPVLVEGNLASNPDIAQAPTGIPLSDTPYPAALEAHLRECLGL